MCDYSLAAVRQRLAQEGDELVTYRFKTGSMGLALLHEIGECAGDPAACCIPPGARLRTAFEAKRRFNFFFSTQWNEEEVVFVELDVPVNHYRDAIRRPNGEVIRLQDMEEGRRVGVVSLEGAAERTPMGAREADPSTAIRELAAAMHGSD